MAETVLITGASRGIGAAAARRFAREGYRVALHYYTGEAPALELTRELRKTNPYIFPVQADIRSRVSILAMITAVQEQLGAISILVNNAGVALPGLFTHQTEEEWDEMFTVNCKGTFLCTQAVLPDMLRRQQGCIINLSSVWGITGASCEAAYSASKGALIAFTKAMAKELGPSHIRVNCVAPGVVDTDMNAALTGRDRTALAEEAPRGRIGRPAEIADVIFFLASPAAAFVTGQVLSPNGGLVI